MRRAAPKTMTSPLQTLPASRIANFSHTQAHALTAATNLWFFLSNEHPWSQHVLVKNSNSCICITSCRQLLLQSLKKSKIATLFWRRSCLFCLIHTMQLWVTLHQNDYERLSLFSNGFDGFPLPSFSILPESVCSESSSRASTYASTNASNSASSGFSGSGPDAPGAAFSASDANSPALILAWKTRYKEVDRGWPSWNFFGFSPATHERPAAMVPKTSTTENIKVGSSWKSSLWSLCACALSGETNANAMTPNEMWSEFFELEAALPSGILTFSVTIWRARKFKLPEPIRKRAKRASTNCRADLILGSEMFRAHPIARCIKPLALGYIISL